MYILLYIILYILYVPTSTRYSQHPHRALEASHGVGANPVSQRARGMPVIASQLPAEADSHRINVYGVRGGRVIRAICAARTPEVDRGERNWRDACLSRRVEELCIRMYVCTYCTIQTHRSSTSRPQRRVASSTTPAPSMPMPMPAPKLHYSATAVRASKWCHFATASRSVEQSGAALSIGPSFLHTLAGYACREAAARARTRTSTSTSLRTRGCQFRQRGV